MGHPKKIFDPQKLARKLFEDGAYVISSHAKLRQKQRRVTFWDIKKVVEGGYHEKRKDEYNQDFEDWNYALRGKTLNGDDARICVAFDDLKSVVVITVIRLGD